MAGVIFASGALVALVLGPALAYVRLVPPMAGLLIFAASAPLGLVATAWAVWACITRGVTPAMWVGTAGIIPVAILAIAAVPAFRFPRINDISTDVGNPPVFTHAATLEANRGRDLAFPPSFADAIRHGYPDLEPVRLPLDADTAYDRARDAAEAMADWQITRRDAADREIEAVASTGLFRFNDDIVIRVRPNGDNASIVDMRSKSRDGQGDLGANAKRIRTYFATLTKQ